MWTISLPLSVPVSKKKDFILNLNHYRNTHFLVLNKAKVVFKERVVPLLKHIPKLQVCNLEFVLFPGSNHLCDVSNVCAIVEKFFNDAFVESGKLDDDSYKFVPSSRYSFGKVDKTNPRVEVTIYPIEEQFFTTPKDDPMQILLIQSEIEQAITDFVHSQINIKEGMQVNIELKATRGDAGMQAMVDVVPASTIKPKTLEIVAAVVKAKPVPVEAVVAVVEAVDLVVVDETIAEPVKQTRSLFQGLEKPVNV